MNNDQLINFAKEIILGHLICLRTKIIKTENEDPTSSASAIRNLCMIVIDTTLEVSYVPGVSDELDASFESVIQACKKYKKENNMDECLITVLSDFLVCMIDLAFKINFKDKTIHDKKPVSQSELQESVEIICSYIEPMLYAMCGRYVDGVSIREQ